jgi:tetratricopeptide (TPR) repeat protein
VERPGWRPGDNTRPTRPGGGGAGDRWRPGDNRPGGGDGDRWRPGDNRPGGGGAGDRWRPGDNRPGWRPGDNRPGGDGWAGWRPGENRPNWGNNNGNNYWNNRPIVNAPNNSFNQWNTVSAYGGGYGGYGGYAGYGAYDSGYGGYAEQPYYEGWYQGNWGNWAAPLAAWTTAAAGSWLNSGDNFVYQNPYYTEPQTTVVQPVYNYSEPIVVQADQPTTTNYATTQPPAPPPDDTPAVVAPPAAADPSAAPVDPNVQAATDAFTIARDAFKAGDYAGAQANVEKAIKWVPSDPVLHEFRALALFAQGKYTEAAGTLYAVLARGPGWNWDSMRSLYPDADTYTKQLRALEAYISDHRNDSAARFVLAYQYLVTNQTDPAVRQLQEVVKLTPSNKLAADMLKAMTSTPQNASDSPKAGS